MSQFGLDPWMPEGESAPEAFSIGYDRSRVEPLVYGSLLFAATLMGVGMASGAWIASLASLPVFASVYWNYPFSERKPQLAASEAGLQIEGLGVVPWRAITRIELFETSVRSITLYQLHIQLKAPVSTCVVQTGKPLLIRKFMRRSWSILKTDRNPEVLRIDTHLLQCSPQRLLERLRQFQRLG